MKRKSDAFTQVVVGVFMLTVLLLLGYFTIVISGVDLLTGREKICLTVAFDQVGGLKDHDNVMYRGTKVGTVSRVAVTPTNLIVTAMVDANVTMRERCRVSVCSLSMLGGNYLQLEEGVGEPLDLTAVQLRGESPTDWLADVSKTMSNIRELTDRLELGGIVTNLEAASAAARAVVERIERGEGLVGRLIASDDTIYEDFRTTVTNVREIASRLNHSKLYEDLEATIANARALTGSFDGRKLSADLDAAIADFRKVCASLSSTAGDVNLKGTVAKAEELMDNLNAVASRLRNGEGTLGRLTSDDAMYREVNALIRDVRQIIDNYRDTTPISTFTSLAVGAF